MNEYDGYDEECCKISQPMPSMKVESDMRVAELQQKVREIEAAVLRQMADRGPRNWRAQFDDRERRLIGNCEVYADSDPAGLPGHALMLIIAKMAVLLDREGEAVKLRG